MEQHLVAVLQFAQERVAGEIVGQPLQRPPPPLDLAVERADMRRQQAVQAEGVALRLGEGGALVGQRIGKERAGGDMRTGDGMVSVRSEPQAEPACEEVRALVPGIGQRRPGHQMLVAAGQADAWRHRVDRLQPRGVGDLAPRDQLRAAKAVPLAR